MNVFCGSNNNTVDQLIVMSCFFDMDTKELRQLRSRDDNGGRIRKAVYHRMGDKVDDQSQFCHTEGKLKNASFVEKAPAEVVARERQKQSEAAAALATLQDQLRSIANG